MRSEINPNPIKQNVAIIGATGSVGGAVIDICERFPDRFNITALVGGSNLDALEKLSSRHRPRFTCLVEPKETKLPRHEALGDYRPGCDGLASIVCDDSIDHVVFAASGTATIPALCEAIQAGKQISLANKESIVVAGPWVMPLLRHPDQLRPVDSEHSAIWQCLRDEPQKSVRHIWLTASGGPFRDWSREQMGKITPEDALKHPVWAMGSKITIDSATLMNKGIECIEAMQLFDLPHTKVGALIHPGSQVHGAVLFDDSTIKLLISPPDMRLPAAAALAWPERLPLIENGFAQLPPDQWQLQFSPPDTERFPCFKLAMQAGEKGGAYPALLIGADEIAVQAFLERRISFMDIPSIISEVFEAYQGASPQTLEEAISLVSEGRNSAERIIVLRKRG